MTSQNTSQNRDDILNVDAIVADLRTAGAPHIWQALAARAARDTNLSEYDLYERLIEQEARNTSGIGNGVAIPQLRLRNLTRPYTLFARVPRKVDISAVDGQPADLFFLMLSPTTDIAGHLRRLSRLSRLMRDAQWREQLRGVENEDGLSALFLASPDLNLAA